MTFHRRRLPHWRPDHRPLFLTWHLHGSLPSARFPPPGKLSAGQAFAFIDRYLDEARTGPSWLRLDPVAELVVDSIIHCAEERQFYDLEAFVIMPNHVHLLVHPKVPASEFLRSLKGYTAREANKLLQRTGEPFWQHESYDRWVRDRRELERIRGYIERNPVQAGLARSAEDYRWSSAAKSGTNA